MDTVDYNDYDYHGMPFQQSYRCYPASLINKSHLENGDKIIMPTSALDRLAYLNIDYPMLFELHNPFSERVSHCGVMEFTADEGMIYLPHWMMENMNLQEGDIVHVRNATLAKGTYVKLQPHTKNFLDISNLKAILEMNLRNFSCLTTGDTIMIAYNNEKYYIDTVDVQPSSAVSIIETDCEVDFAPPLDCKEQERLASPASSSNAPAAEQEEPSEPEPKFKPFTGIARRLDGKPVTHTAVPASNSKPKESQDEPSNGWQRTKVSSSSRVTSGTLLFGSNKNHNTREAQQVAIKHTNQPQPHKEEPKFQAFTGKKYSLRA